MCHQSCYHKSYIKVAIFPWAKTKNCITKNEIHGSLPRILLKIPVHVNFYATCFSSIFAQ